MITNPSISNEASCNQGIATQNKLAVEAYELYLKGEISFQQHVKLLGYAMDAIK